MSTAAEITALELRHEITAIILPKPGQDWAVSANGHWDYEPVSPTMWHAWDRRRQTVACYAPTCTDARRQTFEMDHPLHTVPRKPEPARWSVA